MRSYSQLSEFDLLLDLDLDLSKINHFQILMQQLIPESFVTPQLKLWSESCPQTNKQTDIHTGVKTIPPQLRCWR